MDAELLDQSLSFHGSALMQQLMEEHGEGLSLPAAVKRRFSDSDSPVKDRWMAEDKSDPQFMTAVQKFIARKADMLFHPARKKDGTRDTADSDQPEDVFGIMPPLESFMGVPPDYCQEYFYESLCMGDLVVGVVVSVSDSGIIASLLCTETPGLHRDIDELDISAFCPAKELPRMFAHQSVTEAYHPRDVFRGCVIGVNPDKKRIFVSLKDRSSSDQKEDLPKIGLISKDDFPVHYRRKLERCGLTFGQLLQSVLGFTNKGSVDTLQVSLGLDSAASLMRGLHGAKIPDEEYAERLRKWQTNKQAHSSVVAGVELVKKGRQLEAIQHLNMALKIDPGHTEALVARGAVYANNASYLKAIEDFQKALESDPKHVNAKKYLVETKIACARRHEEEGSVDDAVEYYRDVMKTDPSSMEAKQGYERCRHRQGEEESSKGHKSADVVSVSSSEEGGDIQKSADKLLRLMKAEKKKKRKSGDVSPPSSSKKSKHKKERRKSKHQSDSPSSSSSSSSSSRSSSPQRDSPHTKLNRLWEEFQSQGKQPTHKGRPLRSAFSRSASRNRSRSKSNISSSSSNSRSRSGSGVKTGRQNEGAKAGDTSSLSNKWDDLSTYIGGASKHFRQILAGVNQRRRDSGGGRRSSDNSESADSSRDRRRSRGGGRERRDSWRSGDRSFSPGGRRDKHRRGSGQSRERSKYRRDERRESRSDRDGDRRRSRDSRDSKGKKDRRKSGEGKKRKGRKKSRDSKKKLKGHNSKRDKDVKQEDESEIWVEATKEYTGKNSKESTIHVDKEDGPGKVQLKETDEERTLKAQHADSKGDKGQQHSQVKASDSPQLRGSEKDLGGSIKHGVEDEHESQRGREVKRKTYPAVEDPPIIERKGTLTVASKWDSPTRRSRWDTTKDGNDSMMLTHMAMRDENVMSQSSQELQKNQLQGELTQPRGEGVGGGDKDASSNQHDSQDRQEFGETYSKWSRGRDFDKQEDSPEYVTGKWTETGISVSSRGEGDTERDVSREASSRWPQEKSAQRGSGAELSSQRSGAESDVRRFKEGPHGGTDEDLHDKADKGERGKSSTKEMFKLANRNMEVEESEGSNLEKMQEQKAKEIRELLHQHLTLQDLEFPNLSTKQLQQRLYQEIAAHISATNSPATTTDGSRSTRLTDPRVAEGEKSPEGQSQREGKGRLDVRSNDVGSGRKEKAEAGDGVDVSAHPRPEKKEDTHGRGAWKRKEESSDDGPPHHADQREREEESPETRKDRKSKRGTSRERDKSSRTEREGRHRSTDKDKRSRRDKSGYGRAEDSGTSLWVEKIVSNVDVKPAEKINPGDVDIKFLFRTSSGTVDSSFTRQLVPGNLSSSTSKSRRRSQSPSSSVERDSSSTKKRRSSSQKEYGNGRSRSKKKKPSASSSSSSSSDRQKDKKRSSSQRRKRHRSTSSSSSTSDDDGRQAKGSSQKAKRRKRSASSSSSSSSSDVQRKKKYSSSQQAKNKKTVKSSKKMKQYSSSSSSSSSSPPPVKRRTSQGEKTTSTHVQSRHEVYRQDVVKRAKATVAPHTVIQKVETTQPSDSKLNELEDFLKELKSKKKEKQIAEGRAKKT